MLIQKFLQCVYTFAKVREKMVLKLEKKLFCDSRNSYCTHTHNGPWSVLFFGTDEFALYSLQTLFNTYSQDGLLCRLEVVTNYKGEENAVIKYAKENKLVIHNWPLQILEREFDIGVVVSFGHLIPSKIINLFPLGMINVHGSLLPRWRGAAPICHTLMNGDTCTGISIMRVMPKRFDIGSVVCMEKTDIQPHETYVDLYSRLAIVGAKLLIDTIKKMPDILNTAQSQSEEKATYAPKITQETSFIKWENMTAENVYNLQRALTGIQPLRSYFNGQIIKLLKIKPISKSITVNCAQEKIPGLVVYDKKSKTLFICCKNETWITVETVLIPGRKRLSASDFGAGFILNQKQKSCIFC